MTEDQRAGDAGPGHPRQRGTALRDRILVPIKVVEPNAAAAQEDEHGPGDEGGQVVQVVEGGRLELREGRNTECILDVDAIEDQGVEMDVQIQRAAEALHRNHRAGDGQACGPQLQCLPGPQALKSEALLHGGLRDRPTELAVIGQEVAEHFRQAEHELAQGHWRQHPLAQPGGALVHHSPGLASRTESRSDCRPGGEGTGCARVIRRPPRSAKTCCHG